MVNHGGVVCGDDVAADAHDDPYEMMIMELLKMF